jgi:hypothetical protein
MASKLGRLRDERLDLRGFDGALTRWARAPPDPTPSYAKRKEEGPGGALILAAETRHKKYLGSILTILRPDAILSIRQHDV